MPACTRRTQNKVPIKHSARQVTQDDFRKFDYILAADEANLRDLNRTKPRDATAEVRLWGSYLDNKPVPDPYYGGMVCFHYTVCINAARIDGTDTFSQNGFENVFKQCTDLSNAFLDNVFGASTQGVE